MSVFVGRPPAHFLSIFVGSPPTCFLVCGVCCYLWFWVSAVAVGMYSLKIQGEGEVTVYRFSICISLWQGELWILPQLRGCTCTIVNCTFPGLAQVLWVRVLWVLWVPASLLFAWSPLHHLHDTTWFASNMQTHSPPQQAVFVTRWNKVQKRKCGEGRE